MSSYKACVSKGARTQMENGRPGEVRMRMRPDVRPKRRSNEPESDPENEQRSSDPESDPKGFLSTADVRNLKSKCGIADVE